MAHILVTDGGYKHTLGIVRSLSVDGHVVDCIGTSFSLCRFSKHLNKVAYPQEKFNEYCFDEFEEYIECSEYDQIIAIGGKSVDLLSKNREKLRGKVSVELAPKESIAISLSKKRTLELASSIGILCPKVYEPTSSSHASSTINALDFPLVIKSSCELSNSKPVYVKNYADLQLGISEYKSQDKPLIQECIDGYGVGFFAIYDRGKIKKYFMHRRVRENPPAGGPSVCAVSIHDSDVLSSGKKLLDSLNWHGVAMVEFKRQRLSGELYLMEVNPKFWGSHDLAIASGIDFSKAIIDLSKNTISGDCRNYKVGVKYHWPLNGDLVHVIKRPSSAFAFLVDSLNPSVKSNILFSDLLPSVFSLFSPLIGAFVKKVGLAKHINRISKIGWRGSTIRWFTELTGVPIMRYSRISPKVAIGMQHSILGKFVLKAHGFGAVLNLRDEFDDLSSNLALANYKQINVKEFSAPSFDQLDQGVRFISSNTSVNVKVYVHCREGVSRAPLFAAAYLIKAENCSVEEAISRVARTRSFINILSEQVEALENFYYLSNSKTSN